MQAPIPVLNWFPAMVNDRRLIGGRKRKTITLVDPVAEGSYSPLQRIHFRCKRYSPKVPTKPIPIEANEPLNMLVGSRVELEPRGISVGKYCALVCSFRRLFAIRGARSTGRGGLIAGLDCLLCDRIWWSPGIE